MHRKWQKINCHARKRENEPEEEEEGDVFGWRANGVNGQICLKLIPKVPNMSPMGSLSSINIGLNA